MFKVLSYFVSSVSWKLSICHVFFNLFHLNKTLEINENLNIFYSVDVPFLCIAVLMSPSSGWDLLHGRGTLHNRWLRWNDVHQHWWNTRQLTDWKLLRRKMLQKQRVGWWGIIGHFYHLVLPCRKRKFKVNVLSTKNSRFWRRWSYMQSLGYTV